MAETELERLALRGALRPPTCFHEVNVLLYAGVIPCDGTSFGVDSNQPVALLVHKTSIAVGYFSIELDGLILIASVVFVDYYASHCFDFCIVDIGTQSRSPS